jgi:hypothetical protein
VTVKPVRDSHVEDAAETTEQGDHPTTFGGVIRAIARVDASPALAPGQVLDDTYELVERLGGGGMGVVFHARDRRLGRAVALKVLKPGSPDKSEHLRRLFEREARATAQLLHPNIVTLHDIGEHAGSPYLVLELLQGETLAARLVRRRQLPVGDALAILDAVLGALAFAHERGVLHRDLKPTNVFITVDERVKVLDFGVALSLDTDPGPATRAAGTPGYMAPEQRDGGMQDARTDVWAAALLLVECLTGRRVDDGDAAAALAAIDAPVSVREELARALAVDPAERPATATDLRVALARANAQLTPSVKSPRRWRQRLGIAVFGAAMIAIGATAAVVWPSAPPAPLDAAAITGTWKVNFGTLALRVEPDGTAFGVYEHDEGTLVGRYNDGLFMGRWCESPTRRGPKDAGVLQLHFARHGGKIAVDGRWTYGDSPYGVSFDAVDVDHVSQTQWHTGEAGFFGAKLDVAAPAALAKRLVDRSPCP